MKARGETGGSLRKGQTFCLQLSAPSVCCLVCADLFVDKHRDVYRLCTFDLRMCINKIIQDFGLSELYDEAYIALANDDAFSVILFDLCVESLTFFFLINLINLAAGHT